MPATYLDGKEEMRRAEAILRQQLPPRLQKRLIPVPSPGRASLIIKLYESGYRKAKLDYRALDERWEELAEGSSTYPGDGFLIHADGKSSRVYLGKFLPEILKVWNERPGTPSWPHEPCVLIDARHERVTFFGEEVSLQPHQYELLRSLVELSGRDGKAVANPALRQRFDSSENINLPEVMSRVRAAFRATARELGEVLVDAAAALVAELIPRKRPGLGYRIGRPELFSVA